jgi:hypothetical protein
MRLLNPSPGEILDRLSILELKIGAASRLGVSSTHFEAEKASLEPVLQNWEQGISEDCIGDGDRLDRTLEEVARHKNGLAAANALLWRAEDDLRRTPDTETYKLARLAKQIAAWNDARAYHVRGLDSCYGLEDGPEKIYAKTHTVGK